MRALALVAVSAVLLAAGCAKKDDSADMNTPPADTAPTTPAPMPSDPAPSPTPSETPPAPDATTPPADTGTTPPPPAQ
jgi:hypothetical protein